MLQRALFLSFPILSLVFLPLSAATNSLIYVKCSELRFNSMTPSEMNLNSLFTSIVNSASLSNFNNFTISLPETSPSDVVYGLYQCRGDLSNSDCRDCMVSSVSQLKTTCSLSINGVIQLAGCFLRYDKTSFFGVEDKMEVSKSCGPPIGYNTGVVNRIDDALASLIVGNGQYFRAGGYGSIQGVAQCIQDLCVSECQDCILEARGRLRSECETSTWGDMYLGKCYIRYADRGLQPRNGNGNGNDRYNPNDNTYNYDYDNDLRKERKKTKRVKKMAIIIGASVGGAALIGGTIAGIIYKKRAKRCH